MKLPGIGIFSIDPSIPVPDPADKNFQEYINQIKFVQTPISNADEAFINFIRTETGKIKPLAESDLDSFLSDGKILLNIGKPFQIEGIGYLQKNREGAYEFTAGEPMLQRQEHAVHDNPEHTGKSKSFFSDDAQQQNNIRKIVVGLGAIAGIVLVVWLGYILYNRNSNHAPAENAAGAEVVPAETSKSALLDSVQSKIDSVRSSVSAADSYKFIIERTSNKARAYRRYNQIKENLQDVKMESKDSTLFSLYFVLPASPADTARIKDSLKIWYGRKQVYVEK